MRAPALLLIALYLLLEDEGLTVICLSNMPTGDAEGKARQVLEIVLDKSPQCARNTEANGEAMAHL